MNKYNEFKTILREYKNEIEINKSKFITHIKRVNSEEESIEFIQKISKLHYDATHNCSAYINGPLKLIQRYDDDGEPQGTAGIPMLEVLKKEDLTDIAVVVTRYFGGKKLGASGLIRAYGGSVSEVLKKSEIIELKNYYMVSVIFDYSYLGRIENYFKENKFYLKSRNYMEKIENILYISIDKFENFRNNLLDITSANIEIDIKDIVLLQVKDGEVIE